MSSNCVAHQTCQPRRVYPGLGRSQGAARHTYLRQLRDLNEPLKVLKVAGAVKQIFQPGDGEAPEGAGGLPSSGEGTEQPPSFPSARPAQRHRLSRRWPPWH